MYSNISRILSLVINAVLAIILSKFDINFDVFLTVLYTTMYLFFSTFIVVSRIVDYKWDWVHTFEFLSLSLCASGYFIWSKVGTCVASPLVIIIGSVLLISVLVADITFVKFPALRTSYWQFIGVIPIALCVAPFLVQPRLTIAEISTYFKTLSMLFIAFMMFMWLYRSIALSNVNIFVYLIFQITCIHAIVDFIVGPKNDVVLSTILSLSVVMGIFAQALASEWDYHDLDIVDSVLGIRYFGQPQASIVSSIFRTKKSGDDEKKR